MTFWSGMRRFVRSSGRRRLFQAAYQSALQTDTWRTQGGLHALLGAGIACVTLVAAQQMIRLATMVPTPLSQPPKRQLNLSFLPVSLPGEIAAAQDSDSLFALPRPTVITPPQPAPVAESPVRPSKPEPAVSVPHWQIEIQVSPVPETATLRHSLANATHDLQAGNIDTASQEILTILERDPHQVEALEAMLFVSRSSGDISSEEMYLERLRQAVPDYEYDREVFLSRGPE